jgi:hypothetical protein
MQYYQGHTLYFTLYTDTSLPKTEHWKSWVEASEHQDRNFEVSFDTGMEKGKLGILMHSE